MNRHATYQDLRSHLAYLKLAAVAEHLPAALEAGPPRDYLMRWVEVPSLEVSVSEQRHEPLGNGVARFSAGDFVAQRVKATPVLTRGKDVLR
jgi:hypothetical protein